MNDSAQPSTAQPSTAQPNAASDQFRQKLRSSFMSSGVVGSAFQNQSPVSDQTPDPQSSNVFAQDVVANSSPIDSSDLISDSQKLEIFSRVLDQVEAQPTQVAASDGLIGQTLLQTVSQNDTLNPQQGGVSTAKERLENTSSPDQGVVDGGAGITYVEQERSAEIPVEVESYLQKVEDHSQDQPHEVVIADGTTEQSGTAYPSRPVIVLPITQQTEEEGLKKSPKFSIRWLVEWSQKVIKMFAGKVIYREA